jgi:hypothetical protein
MKLCLMTHGLTLVQQCCWHHYGCFDALHVEPRLLELAQLRRLLLGMFTFARFFYHSCFETNDWSS